MTETTFTVGHVHLKVRDLDVAVSFYTEILGLEVTERQGRYVFLSWGEKHHDVALQEVGESASGPSSGVGLYHAAIEAPDERSLAAVYARLEEREIAAVPVDHGISKSLYFTDPDGNGIEVYLDTRAKNNQEVWEGKNERFDPARLQDS